MLALTFQNPADYELIRQDDVFDLKGYDQMTPGVPLELKLHHQDGSSDQITLNHTYNAQQIEWLREGSALNKIRKEIA